MINIASISNRDEKSLFDGSSTKISVHNGLISLMGVTKDGKYPSIDINPDVVDLIIAALQSAKQCVKDQRT
ncbi:hypothetical protein [Sphingobium yanoikuyae]|uniref:hypothetical protein n=1 Tax=Sphingobium yanoikuyae TaxID=13690 RepID=UPI0026F20CDE|nr:hypothetical protein [Sphingobium yanoikuyae]